MDCLSNPNNAGCERCDEQDPTKCAACINQALHRHALFKKAGICQCAGHQRYVWPLKRCVDKTCLEFYHSGVNECRKCDGGDHTICTECEASGAVLKKDKQGCECPPGKNSNGDPLNPACVDSCTTIYTGEAKCSTCDWRNKCTRCEVTNAVPSRDGNGCQCPKDFAYNPATNSCETSSCKIAHTGENACYICSFKNLWFSKGTKCDRCSASNAIIDNDGMSCRCPDDHWYDPAANTCYQNCKAGGSGCSECDPEKPFLCSACEDPNKKVTNDVWCECKTGFTQEMGEGQCIYVEDNSEPEMQDSWGSPRRANGGWSGGSKSKSRSESSQGNQAGGGIWDWAASTSSDSTSEKNPPKLTWKERKEAERKEAERKEAAMASKIESSKPVNQFARSFPRTATAQKDPTDKLHKGPFQVDEFAYEHSHVHQHKMIDGSLVNHDHSKYRDIPHKVLYKGKKIHELLTRGVK